jgi:hypothetical protein
MSTDEDRVRELLNRATPEPRYPFRAETVLRDQPGLVTADDLLQPAGAEPGTRWHAGRRLLPVLAAVVVVAAVAVGLVVSRGNGARLPTSSGTEVLSNSPTPDFAPSTSTSSSAPPKSASPCLPGRLTAAVTSEGSTASAPYVIVSLHNSGSDSCTISGYPTLTVLDSVGHRLPTVVHHGTYEQPDAGPMSLVLKPGGAVSFAIGTSTAYQGGRHVLTIERILIGIPTSRSASVLTLTLAAGQQLGATAPSTGIVPIGITAFAPGEGN